MGLFEPFWRIMTGPSAPQIDAEIADLLAGIVRDACATHGLDDADIRSGGGMVTMFLTEHHAWEAVVVGPDAYQLYPGFLNANDGSLTWPNIWVADDYTLSKFVRELEAAFDEAARPVH